jgi:hypothetical protein
MHLLSADSEHHIYCCQLYLQNMQDAAIQCILEASHSTLLKPSQGTASSVCHHRPPLIANLNGLSAVTAKRLHALPSLRCHTKADHRSFKLVVVLNDSMPYSKNAGC